MKNTEKTFYNNQQNTLREVHTEKYDHNVVVKAKPTYLYLSLRTACPAIALRSNWAYSTVETAERVRYQLPTAK